ncbi:Cocaine esterase [Lachnellula suecica]|uniref:Cocaine esterase n=1 Tax=Lachnellula suecica TaxID=602035 RepID=A0A8T9BUY0_9HELO|nr:Cocaine esterase [Lachnellula suecica]
MHFFKRSTFLAALAAFGSSSLTPLDCNLQIQTSSGVLNGFINPPTPDVRQFLGVPFSLPPTGNRRWLPPSKLESTCQVAATNIGPACPQLLLADSAFPFNTSVYSPLGGNQTEYFPLDDFSEDCLTLNIWTPRNATGNLPVIVWFFGGGFTQGGTNSLYFNPESWVQRTQQHIVVTVNFRSNIFGFPNAAGLSEQNLGLLDQRLALEWTRENIARFGGNSSQIVDWGESAGATAVDYLDFAYPTDPIVSGKIMDSTTALFPSTFTDTNQTFFATVGMAFNCTSVDCLRNVSWQSIEAYLSKHATLQFLQFPAVPDERIVFSNYTPRYAAGAFSSVPAIILNNQYELNALNYTEEQKQTGDKSFCISSAAASQFREAQNRTTYRFYNTGNFSNLSPPDYTGAYHASELPLIMGTAGKYHGASTEFEDLVSEKLQDLWLDFARDPESGLRKAGWGSYKDGKALLIGEGNVAVQEMEISALDGAC